MFMGAVSSLGKYNIRKDYGDRMAKIFDKSSEDYAYLFVHMNDIQRKKFISWYNKWNEDCWKRVGEYMTTLPITDEYFTELSLYIDTTLMLRCCPRRLIHDIWGGSYLETHMLNKYLELPSSVTFLQRCDALSQSQIYNYVKYKCKNLDRNGFSDLPKDIVLLIFNLLSDRDLSNLSRTSISMFVFVKRLWHKNSN